MWLFPRGEVPADGAVDGQAHLPVSDSGFLWLTAVQMLFRVAANLSDFMIFTSKFFFSSL
jgi:hypothetical protein